MKSILTFTIAALLLTVTTSAQRPVSSGTSRPESTTTGRQPRGNRGVPVVNKEAAPDNSIALSSDELLETVKCKNYNCFKQFVESKKSDFVFSSSLKSNGYMFYNYQTRNRMTVETDKGDTLQNWHTGNLSYQADDSLHAGDRVNYMTYAEKEYSRLLQEFQLKGFVVNKTEEPSKTQTLYYYSSVKYPEVFMAVLREIRPAGIVGKKGTWLQHTFILTLN